MNFYWTTLGFPHGLPQSVIDNILLYAVRFEQYIIVKEFGALGKNPHINFIYSVPDNLVKNWSKNSYNNFIKMYKGLELPSVRKYLINTKICSTPGNVIGGYLQKEAKAIIIKNVGFDLEQMREEALDGYIEQKITIHNAADVIHQWQTSNDMKITSEFEQFSHAFDYMLRLGYKLAPFIRKQKDIFIIYTVKYHECHSFDQI